MKKINVISVLEQAKKDYQNDVEDAFLAFSAAREKEAFDREFNTLKPALPLAINIKKDIVKPRLGRAHGHGNNLHYYFEERGIDIAAVLNGVVTVRDIQAFEAFMMSRSNRGSDTFFQNLALINFVKECFNGSDKDGAAARAVGAVKPYGSQYRVFDNRYPGIVFANNWKGQFAEIARIAAALARVEFRVAPSKKSKKS